MNLQEHLAALHCEKHVGCLEYAKEVRADAFAFIREEVEGVKRGEPKVCACENGRTCAWHAGNGGWNAALDEVLEILK